MMLLALNILGRPPRAFGESGVITVTERTPPSSRPLGTPRNDLINGRRASVQLGIDYQPLIQTLGNQSRSML